MDVNMPWGNKSSSEERRAYTRAWYAKNKERVREQRNMWAQDNPDKRRASVRAHNLKRKWGLTPETWEELFDRQGRRCGICGCTEPRGGKWAVDHDHTTGKIRGILCFNCNTSIGKLFDDWKTLYKAAGYLQWHESHKEGNHDRTV